MRTAEEILHKHAIGKDVFIGEHNIRLFRYVDALKAINEARIEAIKECAEVAYAEQEKPFFSISFRIRSAIQNLINQVK